MKSHLGRNSRIGNQESEGFTIATDWSGTTMRLYVSRCLHFQEVSKILLRESSLVGDIPLEMLQYLDQNQIKEIDLSKIALQRVFLLR